MKRFQVLILTFLIGFLPYGVNAQNIQQNELTVIEGKKFVLHEVRTGETIYSISKNFRVDASDLTKYNPEIQNGLNIGDVLKIPFNENVDLAELPRIQKGDPTGFIEHTIEDRKETAYALSKMYRITVEEIYA